MSQDDLRRHMETVKHLPRFLAGDWRAIPCPILTDLICQAAEIQSSPEAQLIREVYREMVESGEWVEHPQVGLVPREVMEEIIRWAREE